MATTRKDKQQGKKETKKPNDYDIMSVIYLTYITTKRYKYQYIFSK